MNRHRINEILNFVGNGPAYEISRIALYEGIWSVDLASCATLEDSSRRHRVDMQTLKEEVIDCPYCGETLHVLLDQQEAGHEYVEDCQVCCKPIIFAVWLDSLGELSVSVRDENEPY